MPPDSSQKSAKSDPAHDGSGVQAFGFRSRAMSAITAIPAILALIRVHQRLGFWVFPDPSTLLNSITSSGHSGQL
jgi:hypothetical protein